MDRTGRIRDLAEAIATRRWVSCAELVYKILYGLPASELLPLTTEQILRLLPSFEKRWQGVSWPRQIVEDSGRWIRESGRSIPDSPLRETIAEAGFVFCLDALLLAASYPDNRSVLTSSCACALRELVGVAVQLRAEREGFEGELVAECQGCGAAPKPKSAPNADSPVELARSIEWQKVLDSIVARNLADYPEQEWDGGQFERDLSLWKEHAELLIVPDSAIA